MGKPAWELSEASRNVHTFRHPNCEPNWEQHYLLISDIHWDNPHCNWDLLKRHCDEAVQRNAPIIVVGDFFCAMQGKYDKRSDKQALRPEHQTGHYLDRLVETAADWWEPYKKHLAIIGYGNHETAISGRHETDLLNNLAQRLRDRGGITRTGGYGGWVRWLHNRGQQRSSTTMFYHHGAGGGGPVTKGEIDFNRMAEWTDADIIATGHVHWKKYTPVQRLRLNQANQICNERMCYLLLGTYKCDYQDGHGGWATEKRQGPRPMGGWWLRFFQGKKQKTKLQLVEAEE